MGKPLGSERANGIAIRKPHFKMKNKGQYTRGPRKSTHETHKTTRHKAIHQRNELERTRPAAHHRSDIKDKGIVVITAREWRQMGGVEACNVHQNLATLCRIVNHQAER